jgi:hypothetical protein
MLPLSWISFVNDENKMDFRLCFFFDTFLSSMTKMIDLQLESSPLVFGRFLFNIFFRQ